MFTLVPKPSYHSFVSRLYQPPATSLRRSTFVGKPLGSKQGEQMMAILKKPPLLVALSIVQYFILSFLPAFREEVTGFAVIAFG